MTIPYTIVYAQAETMGNDVSDSSNPNFGVSSVPWDGDQLP